MSEQNFAQTPLSKKDFMVVEEMPNEVLIYDSTNHKLHVLNPTAAAVWNRCDGQTRVSEIAGKLGAESDGRINKDMTWLALEELEKSGLMESAVNVPQEHLSRRTMIKKTAAAAALALPVVTTLLAPSPARAQSAQQTTTLPPQSSQPLTGVGLDRSGTSGRSRLSDRSGRNMGDGNNE
jgi:Coenzyme PQQ synthesis protein D (PqqD)